MKCCICSATASAGALCEDCQDELDGTVPLTQEQIRACTEPTSTAALVDMWGGAHRLKLDTNVGRTDDPASFAIVSPWVSRRHTRVTMLDGVWRAVDLGSRNGTFVDDRRADTPLPLRTGCRLTIGVFTFFFVEDAGALPAPHGEIGQTSRPHAPIGFAIGRLRTAQLASALPSAVLSFLQPTGGDIGYVEVDGRRLQLSLPQYELVLRLHDRMLEDAGMSATTRGFMTPGELVGIVSFDTRTPGDDNIRQLVHRVRVACRKAEVPQLVESRRGYGYRLAVMPASIERRARR